MKLSPPTLPLMPLRGPLGFKQIYFDRGSSPMLKYLKMKTLAGTKNAWLGIPLIVYIVAAFYVIGHFATVPIYRYAFLWVMAIWVVGDLWPLVAGLAICAKNLHSWRRSGMLMDLSLSGLRPIEIGQFLIWPFIWQIHAAALILFLTLVISWASFMPSALPLIFPLGIGMVNALSGSYLSAWTQLAIFLGSKSFPEYLKLHFNFICIYAFCLLPAYIMIFVAYMLIFHGAVGEHAGPEVLAISLMLLLPLWLYTWIVQYLFARAWASRVECAIFHRIEF